MRMSVGNTMPIYGTLSSPGIAVRRTASLPLAYDRATQYSRGAGD
jgi:hypothetical protein